MNVLVTGGAGYVGSVIIDCLITRGHRAVAYDNLKSSGHNAVSSEVHLVHGDLMDQARLLNALAEYQIEAVIHCAFQRGVGDSIAQPHKYYVANVSAGLMLLDAMLTAGIKRLVFTSTAATYGEIEKMPIAENTPQAPINPYGETMLAFERALKWYGKAYNLRSAILRCFNVAGASDRANSIHDDETHLIPSVLKVAVGEAEYVEIFGEDYPTPDGTCIRDYVHVLDVAEAHVLALEALDKGSCTYNVGYGSGYSVAEVVEMARQITGCRIPTEAAPRRAGEAAVAISTSDKITRELGWQPLHSELDQIIESAWRSKREQG